MHPSRDDANNKVFLILMKFSLRITGTKLLIRPFTIWQIVGKVLIWDHVVFS